MSLAISGRPGVAAEIVGLPRISRRLLPQCAHSVANPAKKGKGRCRAPENGERNARQARQTRRCTGRRNRRPSGLIGPIGPTASSKTARNRGNRRFRRLGQIRGVLPHAGLPVRVYHKAHKGHKGRRRRGGPCVRAKRTSGPEACRAWRASHAMLWFWEPSGDSRRPISQSAPSGGVGRNPSPKTKLPSLQASKLPRLL